MKLDDVLLATHACPDGAVCAILFLKAGGKRKNIYFSSCRHEQTKDLMEDLRGRNKPIIFVDLSIPFEQAEKLDKLNEDIIIFDHHKSAIPLSKFEWCRIEKRNKRCGAMMFYDWLISNEFHHGSNNDLIYYKNLVTMVDDYDRWVLQHKESKDIVTLFDLFGLDLFVDRFVSNYDTDLSAQEQFAIDLDNKRKEEYIKKKVKKAVYYTKEIDNNTVKFAVVMSEYKYRNDLAEALCSDPIEGADFAMIICENFISLRSRKNDCPVDMSKLAELNDGGGHKSAAACTVGGAIGKDLIELIVDNFKFA